MQQIEDNKLMWPRFVAIGKNGEHYPGSPFKVGQVIEMRPIHPYSGYSAMVNNRVVSPEYFEKYPHLFEPINWWDKLNNDEMPKYLQRGVKDKQVFKVECYDYSNDDILVKLEGRINKVMLEMLIPATEAEYLAYINK